MPGSNRNILVVDDNPQNRSAVISILLEREPEWTVYSAAQGQQALHILEKKTVDLLLLDWEMPVMDGLETLGEMAKRPEWKDIPVLMYTGAMTGAQHLERALEAGAIDFLRKPAHPVELTARVHNIFRQKEDEAARYEAERAYAELLKTENKRLQEEQRKQLLLIAQKNELLSDLQKDCEQALEEPSLLKKTIRRIRHEIEQDHWEDFLQQFRSTEPNFYKNLQKIAPDLTSGEQRFCSLIRFGLGNKEIAQLMHISNGAVSKTRYRIRKKLNLDSTKDLDALIMGL